MIGYNPKYSIFKLLTDDLSRLYNVLPKIYRSILKK